MTTVLAHGCFDVLHIGHIEHLQEAATLGDELIVSITADEFVNKGPGRPIHNEDERKRQLEALACVDRVIVVHHPIAVRVIHCVKPDIYVKGVDYEASDPSLFDAALYAEFNAVKSHGGTFATTTSSKRSSTAVIQQESQQQSQISEAAQSFLTSLKAKHSVSDIFSWLYRCRGLSVLCVGEPITDTYQYITPKGRSAKDAMTVWELGEREHFNGGIHAVARHAYRLCGSGVLLPSGFSPSPIQKIRYVERTSMQKWFATVDQGATTIEPLGNTWAEQVLYMPNIILCVDYGHGLIPDTQASEILTQTLSFLALNVQANSLNWGMNTLRKWGGADYIVCNEAEARLALQDSKTAVSDLGFLICEEWGAERVAITQGHEGCWIFLDIPNTAVRESFHVPAFIEHPIDRMGAGDAFLAWTAPLAYLRAPIEIIGLIGNIAGGLQTQTVGNAEPVKLDDVKSWVRRLMAW